MLGLQYLHGQGLRHNSVNGSSVRWCVNASIYEGGVISDFAMMQPDIEPSHLLSDLNSFKASLAELRFSQCVPAPLLQVSEEAKSRLSLVQASHTHFFG